MTARPATVPDMPPIDADLDDLLDWMRQAYAERAAARARRRAARRG